MTTGCNNGRLTDPKSYFFTDVIKRLDGAPAPDWKAVLESLPGRGMGVNPKPGEVQLADAPFYGITVMIDGGGNARGRIWLPTETPVVDSNGNRWFTREIQVIADDGAGGFRWAWEDKGGAQYVPRPCDGSQPGPDPGPPTPPNTELEARVVELEKQVADLTARMEAVEQRPAMAKKIALKDSRGKYVCADQGANKNAPLLANRDRLGAWETFDVEVVE